MQSRPHFRVSIPQTDPDQPDYLAKPDQFTGVVGIQIDGDLITGSGALLYNGRHLVTAAHIFNSNTNTPNLNPDPKAYSIVFDLPSGRVMRSDIKKITVHPNWKSDLASNYDIAILELETQAPDEAERYQAYGKNDEVGQVFDRVGYGLKSTGFTGEVALSLDPKPAKRFGKNRYDALGDIFTKNPESFAPLPVLTETQLAYDFDNGNPENDALGKQFGLNDLGLGAAEVGVSRGDSGGPSFINNQIAGIASYGLDPSIDGVDFTGFQSNNSSFGEMFVDTRISAYLGFINETIALANQGDTIDNGSKRNDTLTGNQGNDILRGNVGDDLLAGGQDIDALYGEAGNDSLFGNRQSDALDGGDGNDALFGGQDADTLIGGAGADRLSGDRGQDVLTGGAGADRFVVGAGDEAIDSNSTDIITDFNVTDDDVIELSGGITPADIQLETFNLSGLGIILRVQATSAAIAFVQGVTAETLTGRLVTPPQP